MRRAAPQMTARAGWFRYENASSGFSPCAQLRASRPRIKSDFLVARQHGFFGKRGTERTAAALTEQHFRRTHTAAAPLAERLFDAAILQRVIGKDDQHTFVGQTIPQRGQRAIE